MPSLPLIGEIFMFSGNFAPRDYALCSGQLLQISSSTALFSILGTTYGGDGRVTFGLPELRGRAPMHPGNGPGLSQRNLGQKSGQENVTLLASHMPSHTHTLRANSAAGDTAMPGGAVLAASGPGSYESLTSPDVNMSATAVQNSGGGQPHTNMQPYLAVNFTIALQGLFPSRN